MMDLSLFGLHGHSWLDVADLALRMTTLSILAVGGAISTAPEMQHYLVDLKSWMSPEQFTASVAMAQAAPGPNVLFVPLLGWKVAGIAGILASSLGIMLPSSLVAFFIGRRFGNGASSPLLSSFTAGLTPLTLGLLLSTGWILLEPTRGDWRALVLAALTVIAMLRARVSPLWLIGLGAAAGAFGVV